MVFLLSIGAVSRRLRKRASEEKALYGKGDYGKSVCMAVETGFDTDCNGATVGSVLGMANGNQSILAYWKNPINDTLHTSIFGVDTVKISDRVKLTMQHIAKQQK